MSPSDTALLDRWIAGRDAEAFEILVERYAGLVYAACMRVLGNAQAAEDVAQESFMKLADALHDAPASLGAWLHTVATRRSINHLTSEKRRRARERNYADTRPAVSVPHWDDIKAIVDEELARLPEDQRSALVAHFLQGRTQAEIARELDLTPQAISYRIKAGLEDVRDALARRGVTLAVAALATLLTDNAIQAAPQTLTAALGKLAIAGANGASAAATAAAAKQGGMSVMVKAGIGSVIVAVASLTAVVPRLTGQPEQGVPAVSQEVSRTTIDGNNVQPPQPPPNLAAEPQQLAQATPTGEAKTEKKTHRLSRELRDPYADRDLPPWYEPDFTRASLDREVKRTSRRLPGRISDPAAVGGTALLHFVNWQPWEVRPEDDVVAKSNVNNRGEFEFTNLPEGNFIFDLQKQNSTAFDIIYVTEQYQQPPISAPMFPGRPIGGSVVDAEGNRIPGARLNLYSSPNIRLPYQHRYTSVANVTANQDGIWYVPHLTGMRHKFFVQAEGYASRITDWLEPGKTDHVTVLDHGGTVKCRLVDAVSKAGMPGAIVYLKGDYHYDYYGGWTDEDGYIELTDIRPGDYELRMEDSRGVMAAALPSVTVQRGATVDAGTIEAVPGGMIRGRIVDASTGNGVPGIQLSARSQHRIPKENITTDDDGYYEIPGVSGSQYDIMRKSTQLYGPYNGQRWIQVVGIPGEIVEAEEIRLTLGIPFQGRVTNAVGRGVAGATIIAEVHGSEREHRAYSDANGYFSVPGLLAPGTVDIQASASGLSTVIAEDVDVPEQGRADVAIALGKESSIEGTITEPGGGPTYPKSIFLRRRPDDRQPDFIEPPFNYSSVQYGRFLIGNLSAGTYDIFMNRETSQRRTGVAVGTVTLSDGEHLTGLRLTTQVSGISITGTVTDSQGRPVHLAEIRANPMQGETWRSSSTQTGDKGRFLLEGLESAKYTVTAEHKRHSRVVLNDVEGGAQNLSIVMPDLGRITGRVVASDGSTIDRFQIYHMAGIQTYQSTMRQGFRSYSDEHGTFVLDRVQSGTNTVFARADGYTVTTHVVPDVRPGEIVANVTLELDPAPTVSGRVTDPQGNPLNGVRIFNDHRLLSYRPAVAVVTTTDDDGWFETSEVQLGDITLVARHDNFAPAYVPMNLAPGESVELDLVLTHGASAEGVVTLDGAPVENVSVSFRGDHDAARFLHVSTTTDAAGRYKIDALPAGVSRIAASFQTDQAIIRSYDEVVELRDGEAVLVDFTLFAYTAQILGRVVDGDGNPVAAQISASSDHANFSTRAGAADGTFRLTGLPEGPVRLHAVATGFPVRGKLVHTTENSVTNVEVVMGDGTTAQLGFENVPDGAESITVSLYLGEWDVDGLTWGEINDTYGVFLASRLSGDLSQGALLPYVYPGQYTLVAVAWPAGATYDDLAPLRPVATVIDVPDYDPFSVMISF